MNACITAGPSPPLTPLAPPSGLLIQPGFWLDSAELEERFTRSPGPGGQNVNKVASGVQLRFDAGRCAALPADVRARLQQLAGRRWGHDGVITLSAHRYRTRERNRQDARQRLAALIRQAWLVPPPRRATQPSAAERERRLTAKRHRAQTKQHRLTPLDAD